jgi:DNA-binding beta-propeller fold protein YncE
MTSRAAAALLLAASLLACQSEVVCASGEIVLDGRCVSLQSDPRNCGAIGRACGAGESCSAGLCCQGSQCPPAVYAACFNGNSVQGATAGAVPVGAPLPMDASGPIALAWQGTSLWVANSISNTLNRMKVSPAGLSADGAFPTVNIPVSGPFSDLEYLAEWNGLLYVSNAAVGSLVVVNPTAGSPIVAEIPLGDFSYPQGMAFRGNKAYVALNGTGQVAVVDLTTRTVKFIELGALGTVPGGALPSRLAVSGDRVYVTLWNLDAFYTPAGNGRLAVIDTTTDALVPAVNPVDLGASCLNPAGIAVEAGTAWVTCGFFPYTATSAADITGAAFVPVNVSGATPLVGSAVPVSLAAPGAITFCNGVGFAADRFSGNVLRFDPVARSVTGRGLVCPPSGAGSSFVAAVACGR